MGGQGRTALMIATEKMNEDIVSSLISHGANINLQDGQGRTALMIAIEKVNEDIVNKLIYSHGVDINLQDGQGRTALMIAIGKDLGISPKEERKNMWMDAVSFLISKGSNLDTQDKQGWT